MLSFGTCHFLDDVLYSIAVVDVSLVSSREIDPIHVIAHCHDWQLKQMVNPVYMRLSANEVFLYMYIDAETETLVLK